MNENGLRGCKNTNADLLVKIYAKLHKHHPSVCNTILPSMHLRCPQVLATSTNEYLHVESALAQQAKEAYVALTAQERLQRQASPLGRIAPQVPGSIGSSHIAQLLPASYLLRRTQLQQYMQQLTLTLGLSKTVRVVGPWSWVGVDLGLMLAST